METYCLICGMPIQHDHYVDTDRPDVDTRGRPLELPSIGRTPHFEIYRAEPRGVKPAFRFGIEHAWLKFGVALPGHPEKGPPAHGAIEDGALLDGSGNAYFVMDGMDEYGAVHDACWQLAGRPETSETLGHLRVLHDATYLLKYQEQLFEFNKLEDDGKGYMLNDPSTSKRNRVRIKAILAEGKKPVFESPSSVAELLASNQWSYATRNDRFWRYRPYPHRELDKTGYPDAFWITVSGSDAVVWEPYENHLLEHWPGILLATVGTPGRIHFITYTHDLAACEALLPTLELPPDAEQATFESEHDPNWDVYYQKIYQRLERDGSRE